MMTISNIEAQAASDAIVEKLEAVESKKPAKSKASKAKNYTDPFGRFGRIAADAEPTIVDAIREIRKRGTLATTSAIASKVGDAATRREVRQALRRLRRHHVVSATIVDVDGRKLRAFEIVDARR